MGYRLETIVAWCLAASSNGLKGIYLGTGLGDLKLLIRCDHLLVAAPLIASHFTNVLSMSTLSSTMMEL
jgi:hypothetical protein